VEEISRCIGVGDVVGMIMVLVLGRVASIKGILVMALRCRAARSFPRIPGRCCDGKVSLICVTAAPGGRGGVLFFRKGFSSFGLFEDVLNVKFVRLYDLWISEREDERLFVPRFQMDMRNLFGIGKKGGLKP